MSDEEIIRLEKSDRDGRKGKPLSEVRKSRLEQSANSFRKSKHVSIKIVDDLADQVPDQEIKPLEATKQRHFYEGKSIEYTIDEIMKTDVVDPQGMEYQWGTKQRKVPRGWIILMSGVVFAAILVGVYMVTRNIDAENQQLQHHSILMHEEESDIKEAEILIAKIDAAVRGYLASKTIDDKISYVRHGETMRARMEQHYKINPMQPWTCEAVTDYKPLTLGGTTFWEVKAIASDTEQVSILVEQLSSGDVKIDWESQVYYQPMPWDEYLQKKPHNTMAFRVGVMEDFRYLGEFSDENRWQCYRLTAKDSDKIVYGYILRGTEAHLLVTEKIANRVSNSPVMILRMQFVPGVKVTESVVIDKVISDVVIRIDQPNESNE